MNNNKEIKHKALFLASMASNLDNFNRNNVKILKDMGYDITLASNFSSKEDTNSHEKTQAFINEMKAQGVHIEQIDFHRKITDFKAQIKSYEQVKCLLKKKFDIIHCHSPICAAITRLCAKKYMKNGISKVFYTAHGFHFYKGAPVKNWLIFYPIEKKLSKYTNVLITINKEDFKIAKSRFLQKRIFYVPGVGIDTQKFRPDKDGRRKIRMELGVSDDQTILLSVGELNSNKNHESVIKSISGMKVVYVIVGIGNLREHLEKVAQRFGVDVRFLGYRNDVKDIYNAADVYVLPSIREGLNVSLMEAMASGLPVACSKIRGNIDLIEDGLFETNNCEQIRKAIETVLLQKESLGMRNLDFIKNHDKEKIIEITKKIYRTEIGME